MIGAIIGSVENLKIERKSQNWAGTQVIVQSPGFKISTLHGNKMKVCTK